MLVSAVIQYAYQLATGKTPLASTDTKYIKLLQLSDLFTQDWSNTPAVDWQSLWRVTNASSTIAQSTSNAGTYATLSKITIPTTIREVSLRENDGIVLAGTDAISTWSYDLIRANQLHEYVGRQACAIINGQLVFATPFLASDVRIGATVQIPGFIFATAITVDSQTVQVDDPLWLAYRMAAEYVRTDLVRRDQYPNLLAIANEKMTAMMSNNDGSLDEVPIDLDLYSLDPNTASGAWGA